MRQYQIPQFITVEDKIVGPFTMKQFGFVGTALFLIIIVNFFLTPFFFFLVSAPIAGLALGLAFIKIDQRPLPEVIKIAFFFYIRPRLYIWRHKLEQKKEEAHAQEAASVGAIPKLSESKLSDLAWSLDMKGREREGTAYEEISPSYKKEELQ